MKVGSLLLFLLVPALCLQVNKSVSGSPLLDVGQTLKIELVVVTDKPTLIDRIEDPLPLSMDASGYPTGCSVFNGMLKCMSGMEIEGRIAIAYTLTAKAKDKRVALEPARVYYEENKIPSTEISNSIQTSYSIGPPELNFTTRRVLIDGLEQTEPYLALPESPISLTFGLKNSGAVPAENVTLSISINQWGLLNNEMVDGLQPDEEKPVRISFSAPKNEGSAEADVKVTWTDPILHRAREITLRIPLTVGRPRVKADRSLELKWVNIDDALVPLIVMQYSLKNTGKLPAKVVLEQEVPELDELKIEPSGTTMDRNTTITLKLEPGESAAVLVQGKATGRQNVEVPSSTVQYYDSRDYAYEAFTWNAETVTVSYSVWATLYSFIGPFGVAVKLLLLGLLIVLSVTTYHLYKSEQPNWYLPIIPLLLVLVLLYSYFVIEGLGWLFELLLLPFSFVVSKATGG